jgi:hypothetical protein
MRDEMRRTHWLADVGLDVRFAARLFAKDLWFTLVVVLTLALGVGANTAMFSVIEAVLLQPLPYRDPDRLVFITENNLTANNNLATLLGSNLEKWRKRANSFAALSVLLTGDATISGEEATQMRVACLSESLTRLFGVAPVLGRDFQPHEFEHAPQAPGLRGSAENRSDTGIAVLSDRFFRRRLGADPGILGQSVVIDNVSYTVVGVLPPSFRLPVTPCGVLTYAVAQRTSEIGLRIALGARQADILGLILSDAATLVLVGVATGLAGSAALSRVISGLLYGVTPTDAWARVTVSLLLIAVALLAAYLPARMAMRVDPMVALRHE